MISLLTGVSVDKNFYPSGRLVWMGTTHTCVPVGKIYTCIILLSTIIKHILAKRKSFSGYCLFNY
jgi:hypothetical protein